MFVSPYHGIRIKRSRHGIKPSAAYAHKNIVAQAQSRYQSALRQHRITRIGNRDYWWRRRLVTLVVRCQAFQAFFGRVRPCGPVRK